MRAKLKSFLDTNLRKGPYRGTRVAFLPPDVALSYLAKQSFVAYRLWRKYFEATGQRFFAGRAPGEQKAGDDDLSDLRTNGFALRRTPFSDDAVDRAREWVMDLYREAHRVDAQLDPRREHAVHWITVNGIRTEIIRLGGRTRFHLNDDLIAAKGVPDVVREFAKDEALRRLAGDYLGTNKVVSGLPYYMAEVLEPCEELEPWHIDCLRATIKVFLTLDAVREESGPLRYIPGSHKVDTERERLFYAICRSGLGVAYFDAPECRRFDATCTRVVSPKNRFIVFDNRGIHAGSLCKSGRRIVLAIGYRPLTQTRVNPRVLRDPKPMPYPWQRAGNDWATFAKQM